MALTEDQKKKNSLLTVTYTSPDSISGLSGDWLRIIQDDRVFGSVPKTAAAFSVWLYDNGYYDQLANNLVDSNILYQQLYDTFYGPCGGGDGTIILGLKVIKARNFGYTLVASRGKLESNGTQEEETHHSYDFDLTHEVAITDYKVEDIKYGYWEGVVFNKYGEQLTGNQKPKPKWYADEQVLRFKYNLAGTYRLVFTEVYDSYSISIPPRVDVQDIYDIEQIYSSTIRAFYEGKFDHCRLDIPDEASECPQYYTDEDGNTQIRPANGLDGTDGAGGTISDECICPYCGGSGLIPDCVVGDETSIIEGPDGGADAGSDTDEIELPDGGETVGDGGSASDCECPNCNGTGRIPGCYDDEDYEGDDSGGSGGGQEPATGKCYELYERRNRCTDELVTEPYLVEVPCPGSVT